MLFLEILAQLEQYFQKFQVKINCLTLLTHFLQVHQLELALNVVYVDGVLGFWEKLLETQLLTRFSLGLEELFAHYSLGKQDLLVQHVKESLINNGVKVSFHLLPMTF